MKARARRNRKGNAKKVYGFVAAFELNFDMSLGLAVNAGHDKPPPPQLARLPKRFDAYVSFSNKQRLSVERAAWLAGVLSAAPADSTRMEVFEGRDERLDDDLTETAVRDAVLSSSCLCSRDISALSRRAPLPSRALLPSASRMFAPMTPN